MFEKKTIVAPLIHSLSFASFSFLVASLLYLCTVFHKHFTRCVFKIRNEWCWWCGCCYFFFDRIWHTRWIDLLMYCVHQSNWEVGKLTSCARAIDRQRMKSTQMRNGKNDACDEDTHTYKTNDNRQLFFLFCLNEKHNCHLCATLYCTIRFIYAANFYCLFFFVCSFEMHQEWFFFLSKFEIVCVENEMPNQTKAWNTLAKSLFLFLRRIINFCNK